MALTDDLLNKIYDESYNTNKLLEEIRNIEKDNRNYLRKLYDELYNLAKFTYELYDTEK